MHEPPQRSFNAPSFSFLFHSRQWPSQGLVSSAHEQAVKLPTTGVRENWAGICQLFASSSTCASMATFSHRGHTYPLSFSSPPPSHPKILLRLFVATFNKDRAWKPLSRNRD